jgi:predicted dehydrogenase
MQRRHFVMTGLGAIAPALSRAAAGPNDRIRVGVAGLNGRGYALARSLVDMKRDNVELAMVCDVDAKVLAGRAASLQKAAGRPIATAGDIRRMIDDKSIDAIVHATPTNWHALGAVWTMQAGKDAYVEKPLALTLWEGTKIVEAARKYDRIAQHGTQCRSSPEMLEAVALLKQGAIGEVVGGRGIGHKYRPSIGHSKAEPVPETLNYDMWRGPAPMKPYSAKHIHYNWHWFWDTGNGELGNLGVHGLDVMRMAMGLADYPERVHSAGGYVAFDDDKQTPNMQTSIFRYRGRKVVLEYSIRQIYSNTEGGMGDTIPFTMGDARDAHGLMIYGTEGYMVLPDYISYYTYLGKERRPGPSRVGPGPVASNEHHLRNFLEAMRSRKRSHLNGEVEDGARSAAMCHLANIAYRVGRALQVDPATGRISGDEEAQALSTRTFRAPYTIPAV